MGIRNKIEESMETMTRAMIIQETMVVLMELVITATSLDTIKHIPLINRGMNKQILMELVITATSLDIIKKISTKNEEVNKQISQSTKK